MSEQELKLFLARQLPDMIEVQEPFTHFFWKSLSARIVRKTEWLHIAWLVEQTLDGTSAASDYALELKHVIAPDPPKGLAGDFRYVNASWQQRAEALCRVKGVT